YRDSMLTALRAEITKEAATIDGTDPVVRSLYYQPGDADVAATFATLKTRLEAIERERDLPGNRLYYLSVAPEFFPLILQNLASAGLIRERGAPTGSRVIIEKPFGTDLQSARELIAKITATLDESQIYRIDHYLGKETVQNILSFRFGNSIFEPLFNQK